MCVVTQKGGIGPTFAMVRFGNVLGSSRSVIPCLLSKFKRMILLRLRIRRLLATLMTITEASQLIIEASFAAKSGEFFVQDVGEPIKIADLGKRVIRLSEYTVRDSNEFKDLNSIEIHYTGLRLGEKISAELCLGEGLVAIQNPKVFQADEELLAWAEVEKMTARVQLAIDE
jgi:FlaA1/EpsC-like NDP-sugar epimerase